MANSVTARAPAWVDGITVSGAEMRSAVEGGLWLNAGILRGLTVTQLPTPNMQIRVAAGLCLVSDGQNGYLPVELLTQTDLDITTSSPTLPRIDSLIAEFVDNGASSIYRFRILPGTPAASPSAPSLPAGDQPTAKTLRIVNIAVAANASTIVNANITPQAGTPISANYGRVPFIASDGARPSVIDTTAWWRSDKNCFETALYGSYFEYYVNSGGPAWPTYTPVVSASTTSPNLGTGSIKEASYFRVGRLVVVRVNVKFGSSGSTAGSGTYRISLPTPAKTLTTGRHPGSAYAYDDSGTNFIDGTAIVDSATWDRVNLVVNNTLATSSAPWTWTNLDAFGFTLSYEAAA